MAGLTNKGKYRILDSVFRGASLPSNFYVALVTNANVPDADTNTFSELTEIANGNGYTTGGYQLSLNETDFHSLTENDTDDRAELQIKDIVWTATGGGLPASGDGARYAVLLNDNGTIANREVWGFWDLISDRSVSATQTLTLQDCEIRLTES